MVLSLVKSVGEFLKKNGKAVEGMGALPALRGV
jgi:hypothetical protein